MPTVVLKLFARQGTRRTDGQRGQSGDYMLPCLGSKKINQQLTVKMFDIRLFYHFYCDLLRMCFFVLFTQINAVKQKSID